MAQLGTAKDIVNQASQEIGLTQKPISTVTGIDQDITQMLALLSNVADEVLLEEPYDTILGDGVWCHDKNGNAKIAPTTDDDVILFDRRLAIDGAKYRFLKAKGLEFGEELRDFTTRMNKIAGRNASVLDLDVDEGRIA